MLTASLIDLADLDDLALPGYTSPLLGANGTPFDTTTSPKTLSVSSNVGELLVGISLAEDKGTIVDITGNSLTWATSADGYSTGATSTGRARIQTAVDTAGGTWTATATRTGLVWYYGFAMLRFPVGYTVGAAVGTWAAVGGGAPPTVGLTTTVANSSVIVLFADWSATNGESRLWLPINGYTPDSHAAGSNELAYFWDSSHYMALAGWYPDVGAAGAKTFGLSAPSVGGVGIAAIEIVPPGGGGPPSFNPRNSSMLMFV